MGFRNTVDYDSFDTLGSRLYGFVPLLIDCFEASRTKTTAGEVFAIALSFDGNSKVPQHSSGRRCQSFLLPFPSRREKYPAQVVQTLATAWYKH